MSGQFELNVPAKKAIGLFTPEGERGWVPGWSPVYPGGEPSESPGTVFTTDAGGVDTIWLVQMIDRTECFAAYSRVTPGRHAGTVQVSCDNDPMGGCVVSVAYDMSLLPGSNPTLLDAYDDASFQEMMNEWAEGVATAL